MSIVCPGKTSWPELLGKSGEEAVEIIESENPNVQASMVTVGTPVTQDFRCDRVRVFVFPNYNVVALVPTVG